MNSKVNKLSFWKWDEWTECWPEPSRESFSFDVSECSEEFRKKWIDDNVAYNVMQKNSSIPASIYSLKSFASRMESWLNSRHSQSVMTYPPTRRGFTDAISQELTLDNHINQDAGILLSVVRPWDVACALSLVEKDRLSPDWQILKEQFESIHKNAPRANPKRVYPDKSSFETGVQKQIKEVLSNKPDVIKGKSIDETGNNQKAGDDKKFEPIKEKDSPTFKWDISLSEGQISEGKKFKDFVDGLKSADFSFAVKKEKMDGFIKKEVMASKGAGNRASGFWFEDVGIHAFCSLDSDTLNDLLFLWPNHAKIDIKSPSSFVDNKNVWRSIRSLKNNDRKFMVSTFLPSIINSDDWVFAEKQKMLPVMLEKTEKYPWLFEERLNLWISWGGDLDLEGPISIAKKSGEELSVFSAPHTQSARDWILDKKIDSWTEVLSSKFPPKSKNNLKP